MHTDTDKRNLKPSLTDPTIPETEQWKLKGDCKKCRRAEHCHKSCTAKKKATDREISRVTNLALDLAYKNTFGLDINEWR